MVTVLGGPRDGTPVTSIPKKFVHALGLDRAAALAIATKLWSTGAGLITTLLVATEFSPSIQGYYYTFLSVLALQIFAELGLGVVITAYGSHEWAQLGVDERGRIVGEADAMSRLSSLGRFAIRWYGVAAAILVVLLTTGGFVFFGSSAAEQVALWAGPWVALCALTGLNLCFVPLWSLLEGCNQVTSVYASRLVQSIATSATAWIAISLGAGLWVVPLIALASLLAAAATIGRRHHAFFRQILLERPSGPQLAWKSDILPMQWRVALSWLSGYFTFYLFTPVLFHWSGAVVAGRMGMTWALIGVLTGVAASWIATKAPMFGILIAQRRFDELDRMFWRLSVVVVVFACAGAATIWTAVYVLNAIGQPAAARLLPPKETGYLLLGTIIVCASLPMSTYLRAHKREPLLVVSIGSGLLTGASILLLGRYRGAEGAALGYVVSMALVAPFIVLVWQRRRTEWHSSSLLTN